MKNFITVDYTEKTYIKYGVGMSEIYYEPEFFNIQKIDIDDIKIYSLCLKESSSPETFFKKILKSNKRAADDRILFQLLENQKKIPEKWKNFDIAFFGTIFQLSKNGFFSGRRTFKVLCWNEKEKKFESRENLLDGNFYQSYHHIIAAFVEEIETLSLE